VTIPSLTGCAISYCVKDAAGAVCTREDRFDPVRVGCVSEDISIAPKDGHGSHDLHRPAHRREAESHVTVVTAPE